MIKVKFKKFNNEVILPSYGHPGDAGVDLFSLEDKELKAGEKYTFNLGFALEFEDRYVAIIKDKSGLSNKYGLHVLGGVYDSGYRGEYSVGMINLGKEEYKIKKGDKIAQLLIIPFEQAKLIETDEFSESSRADGRFGSTGR